MTTHYQHPITFLDSWSWPQNKKIKIKERDINLLMRNALVWFLDTNKQTNKNEFFPKLEVNMDQQQKTGKHRI
jgi:hypothetical protein